MGESHEHTPDSPPVRDSGTPFSADTITKYGTILAIVSYSVGVLAINMYLHALGITDFSFAKPKLILVGADILFAFVLLAPYPAMVAWRFAHPHTRARTLLLSRRMLWPAVPLIVLLAASAYLCLSRGDGFGRVAFWKVWSWTKWAGLVPALHECLASVVIAAGVYLPVCIAIGAAFRARRLYDRAAAEKSPTHATLERGSFTAWVAISVMSFIVYVHFFTLTFYSSLGQAIGGGQPYYQSIAVAPEERCQLGELGIPFISQNASVTQPLPVLHESDTVVAFWLRGGKQVSGLGDDNYIVVQLDKKLVNGARVHLPGERPPDFTRREPTCETPLVKPPDSAGSKPKPAP